MDSICRKSFYTHNRPKETKTIVYNTDMSKLEKVTDFWDEKGNKTLVKGTGTISYEENGLLISGKVKDYLKIDEWHIVNKKENEKQIIYYQNGKQFDIKKINLNKPDEILIAYDYKGSIAFSNHYEIKKYISLNFLKYQNKEDTLDTQKSSTLLFDLDIENEFEENFKKFDKNFNLNSLEILKGTNNGYDLECFDIVNNLIDIEKSTYHSAKFEKPIIVNQSFLLPIKI